MGAELTLIRHIQL